MASETDAAITELANAITRCIEEVPDKWLGENLVAKLEAFRDSCRSACISAAETVSTPLSQ